LSYPPISVSPAPGSRRARPRINSGRGPYGARARGGSWIPVCAAKAGDRLRRTRARRLDKARIPASARMSGTNGNLSAPATVLRRVPCFLQTARVDLVAPLPARPQGTLPLGQSFGFRAGARSGKVAPTKPEQARPHRCQIWQPDGSEGVPTARVRHGQGLRGRLRTGRQDSSGQRRSLSPSHGVRSRLMP
jgi:hypothetical protein